MHANSVVKAQAPRVAAHFSEGFSAGPEIMRGVLASSIRMESTSSMTQKLASRKTRSPACCAHTYTVFTHIHDLRVEACCTSTRGSYVWSCSKLHVQLCHTCIVLQTSFPACCTTTHSSLHTSMQTQKLASCSHHILMQHQMTSLPPQTSESA